MNSRHPILYQINTRVWLSELSAQLGRRATLDDIPDEQLDGLKGRGFEWIYLLGAWQTGAAGRAVSRSNPEWRGQREALLRDLKEEDICRSCFAIPGYTVHEALGGDVALGRLGGRLNERGMRVMLEVRLATPDYERDGSLSLQKDSTSTCQPRAFMFLRYELIEEFRNR